MLILTGPPGSGKTTVGRLLAGDAERSVHVHTDDFYAWIARGFVEPWRPESREQNTVVMEAMSAVAARFEQGGYDVVVDGIVGPWFLDPWRALDLPVSYVVLRPSLASAEARAAARTDHPLQDLAVVSQMHAAFSDLGALERHAIDTTALTADETAAEVRRRWSTGALLL